MELAPLVGLRHFTVCYARRAMASEYAVVNLFKELQTLSLGGTGNEVREPAKPESDGYWLSDFHKCADYGIDASRLDLSNHLALRRADMFAMQFVTVEEQAKLRRAQIREGETCLVYPMALLLPTPPRPHILPSLVHEEDLPVHFVFTECELSTALRRQLVAAPNVELTELLHADGRRHSDALEVSQTPEQMEARARFKQKKGQYFPWKSKTY
jgi:hypothetical protein